MHRKKLQLIILLLLLCLWIIWGNTAVAVTVYPIYTSELGDAFYGYRIAQVSDLHNAEFGKENQILLDLLRNMDPDIIVITGDLVDSKRTDISIAAKFLQQAGTIAPCYYVSGNHEAQLKSSEYQELNQALTLAGVTILHNKTILLSKDGHNIALTGMAEPGIPPEGSESIPTPPQWDAYHILLAHHPERFTDYSQAGYDLIFSGHTHGGQIQIPVLGGIFAPGQGLFPRYDAGEFANDRTQMLVSRGLGNSLFPFRINNRPEIVLAELYPSH